jgi:hypothetical protein
MAASANGLPTPCSTSARGGGAAKPQRGPSPVGTHEDFAEDAKNNPSWMNEDLQLSEAAQ